MYKKQVLSKELLAAEKGVIRKKWHGKLPVALIYPNHYHVGMSSLGYQVVYALFNRNPYVVCERIFLPEDGESPISIESHRPLTDFKVLAFSISFENDYLNVLKILQAAGIPIRTEDRGDNHPLVMAGGVATFLNPEPLAGYIDCFLLGEGEETIQPFLDLLIEKQFFGQGRGKALRELASRLDGLYVPQFYQPGYDKKGRLKSFEPAEGLPQRVKRMSVPTGKAADRHTIVLTPNTEFGDKFLIEIGSGCSRGCRFCAAGFIYRPPRPWPEEVINSVIAGAGDIDKVGLVGVEIADAEAIERICKHLIAHGKEVSFSSLRADCLTPELLATLKTAGLKTVTIAPDAGSERLRRVINKGLDEKTIVEATERLAQWDILNLKLYFMIGLPTEEREDVEAIVHLTKKIKHHILKICRDKRRMGNITLSVNCYVPKPWTPFQWVDMDDLESLQDKAKIIKNGLRHEGNVRTTFDVPKWAYVQALLARGDRRAGSFLEAALKTGSWKKAYKEVELNPDFFVSRERDRDEFFPWDFIDHGLNKDYLWEEYQKALKAEKTIPCQVGKCKRCGVC
ncbi:MAG: radical SAM protein [Deltaproteobacteria bacterium]|nr:radical SAM protein [Deltaproteobacteria bacterium]